MKIGPWRRKSRDLRYQNPWINLYHDTVVTPSGEDGQYGVVDFKSIAIGVLAIQNDQLLMVSQFRYALERESLEIPEGGCPQNEEPLQAAERELLEETGYRAKSWQHLLELDLSNSITNDRAIIFLAKDLEKAAEPRLESTEADLQSYWLSVEDALAKIDDGEIRDAITVAALLKYARIAIRLDQR